MAIEREYKDYGFGDNAKIFFGFYAMVALAAKVLALVVFFTPALKLFRFDTHARSALIPFHTTLGNMSGENLLANTAQPDTQLSHHTCFAHCPLLERDTKYHRSSFDMN